MSPLFFWKMGIMIRTQHIEEILEDLLGGTDKFLVDIHIQPGNRIAVYIDGDNGITIEDCRELSRELESRLDRDVQDFELNVSSAGLDRPLKLLRQYIKNIGREIDLVMKNGEKLSGILTAANETSLDITTITREKKTRREEKNVMTVSFYEVKEAKIKIKF